MNFGSLQQLLYQRGNEIRGKVTETRRHTEGGNLESKTFYQTLLKALDISSTTAKDSMESPRAENEESERKERSSIGAH